MLINFINCKYLSDCLKIEIFNSLNKYVFCNVKNKLKCTLEKGVYKMNVYNCYGYINTYTFIYKEKECINIFYNYNYRHLIKIILTDYHYKDLPIEKGVINIG